MNHTYSPRTGSLAARVIEFFRANSDEELSNNDIAGKFDVPPTSVSALLQAAVTHALLTRSKPVGSGLVYRAGPALKSSAWATETLHWAFTPGSMPDADITVLMDLRGDSVGTWPGYWNGECWIDAGSGAPVAGRVVAWADMPAGSGL